MSQTHSPWATGILQELSAGYPLKSVLLAIPEGLPCPSGWVCCMEGRYLHALGLVLPRARQAEQGLPWTGDGRGWGLSPPHWELSPRAASCSVVRPWAHVAECPRGDPGTPPPSKSKPRSHMAAGGPQSPCPHRRSPPRGDHTSCRLRARLMGLRREHVGDFSAFYARWPHGCCISRNLPLYQSNSARHAHILQSSRLSKCISLPYWAERELNTHTHTHTHTVSSHFAGTAVA